MLDELRKEIDGTVIGPDDAAYEDARSVFLKGFDRQPAAIVRAANADDVARVVSRAREDGAELAVRGGGHSAAGYGSCDGGVVIDLSQMVALEIDPASKTAWAETGLTTGAYTAAAGNHRLATGFGDAGSVGIGGITLGGGIGFLVRKHGLTVDDLLAADVVTADGELVRADAESHPDLFWAIRGGGGNFGVATRLQFRLHELPQIAGGMLMLPATAETIAGFVAAADAAPEELSTIANIMLAPPMPFVPEEHHGKPVLMGLMVYAGDPEDGEKAIAPLRALATPIADMVAPKRYAEMYEGPEAPPPAMMRIRNMFPDAVSEADAEVILNGIGESTAPTAVVQIRVLGGAMARVPIDETAVAVRDRGIMLNVVAAFDELKDAPGHEAWIASVAEKLDQGKGGAYAGFLGDEGEARVREAYPGATWDRLAKIKAQYDPANLFRLNQNIPPA